ncbi:MAG: MoxR family ATPase [Lachnospiraceae bacterium]|nr:MoxR family ATPase [Lachnospiraceae bacterium]
MEKFYQLASSLKENINSVFVGKEEVVEDVLICLLAGGHVLLEDVPGVGKTTLANALAKSMESSLGRIQFTPDTLPGDVLGVSMYNMKTGEFEYKQGVIMNQILLADEINRTSPKTQASLLEAMAEEQITVDGVVYPLPKPFMVIATQNPVEFLGTYPLPEAQMDRFMMRLSIGYPDKEQEIKMAKQYLAGITPDKVKPVCSMEEILKVKEKVAEIKVSNQVLSYIEDIVDLTRKEERFQLGASPRALLALVRASQSKAFLQNRDYVKPDDVKAVASKVLLHRVSLTSEAKIRKESAEKILYSLILKGKIPVE